MFKRRKFPQAGKAWLFGLLVLLILAGTGNVSAADYRFSVPETLVIFAIDSDGKASVSYEFTIENQGKALDYIDIALPNNEYSLSAVQATIDGTSVARGKISRANYEDSGLVYGVTLDNTQDPIPAGQSAEIYVEIQQIEKLLYTVTESDKEEAYVSFQFQPSYFSPDFAFGKTDYTIRLVLPVGITSEEPVYFTPENWPGSSEPEVWFNADGNVVYEWKSTDADSSSDYIFGAMFPQRILTSAAEVSDPDSYQEQYFQGGEESGESFFDKIPNSLYLVVIFVFFLLTRRGRKGKKETKNTAQNGSYLPPSIKAEGEGIKRGLTAVEASVLLEQPMDKILSMIIFSLTKKGAIQIVEQNPLKIQAEDPLPEKLMDYEVGFIEAMAEPTDQKRQTKMSDTISRLILSVTEKMRGYSLEETKAYYKSIIEKAWQQVQDADSPELKGEKLDEIFGWVILDSDIENKTQEVFGSDPVFLPTWWWRMGPIYASPTPAPVSSAGGNIPAGGTPAAPAPSGSSKSTPMLPGADFARSITDSVRNIGVGTVGSVKGFTDQVTGRTNPLAAPSGKSNRSDWSGRGGGGGSSCACACACACAGCACAGGGGGGGR